MFSKVSEADFIHGEHEVLRFWREQAVFDKLRAKNAASEKRWSFLDGPITANNPMGVHHAWGRTYKDVFQRFFAMTGHHQRYQNGFDCQGLWVEVEVEKELRLGTKKAITDFGIDRFVNECKKRVLRFAARQTEQSIRLGYWMDWDDPDELRKLAESVGSDAAVTLTTPSGRQVTDKAHRLVAQLGNPEWGGELLHVLHREQRDDLDVPEEVLPAREDLPRPRRDALVGPSGKRLLANGSRRRPQVDDAQGVLRAASHSAGGDRGPEVRGRGRRARGSGIGDR